MIYSLDDKRPNFFEADFVGGYENVLDDKKYMLYIYGHRGRLLMTQSFDHLGIAKSYMRANLVQGVFLSKEDEYLTPCVYGVIYNREGGIVHIAKREKR
jgi:hypothetical protein